MAKPFAWLITAIAGSAVGVAIGVSIADSVL
jgi:hypothetical protein